MKKLLGLFFTLCLLPSLHGMSLDHYAEHAHKQRAKIAAALKDALTDQKIRSSFKASRNEITISCGTKDYLIPMDELFHSSEHLAVHQDFETLQQHPLYPCFQALGEDNELVTSIKSGPDIDDFTEILLEEHGLDIEAAHSAEKISLNVFTNVEMFLRCLEIFKRAYHNITGIFIKCVPSYKMVYTPLTDFLAIYCSNNPGLHDISPALFDQLVNLLSVFEIDNQIVTMNITLTMQLKHEDSVRDSFKPISLHLDTSTDDASANDISLGQQNLDKQIQNLQGSEIAMPYIKDADGRMQFLALERLLGKKNVSILEIGGGRGETNAVPYALKHCGVNIHLLNAEPYKPFEKPYIEAHKAIGIDDVSVIQKTAQELNPEDVMEHFDGKVDAIIASHSFYFILGDLHKATHAYLNGDVKNIEDHPLAKYITMLKDDGVFVVTLQSGAGGRLFRNALLKNHGLDLKHHEDEIVPLLKSFGNMATFLRHFEFFAQLYEKQTGKKLDIKMHYAVANVPLGGLDFVQDAKSGGYVLHNALGDDADPTWVGPKMMDFSGNWKELQMQAVQACEEVPTMSLEDLATQESAITMQKTFLHILRIFAPGLIAMQHPNITLEIAIN